MAVKAFISGAAGHHLSGDEIAFYREAEPWGLILFKRNCRDRDQVRELVDGFRNAVGRADAPVLIDQEGGRVQRLQPPNWPSYPASRILGLVAEGDETAGRRAAWLQARLIAADLAELGITVDCMPVLDVIVIGASEAIGNRSFGGDVDLVSMLGLAVADGLLDGGVLPVIKHMPGQGRAVADSHYHLPVVDTDVATLATVDLVPFQRLAHLPLGMTGHVVFTRGRSGPAGDHVFPRDPRYHPRANRLQRAADQR